MIPYNPSSFNTNKTILEQILELKKWLKEHPSYAVYTTYIHYKPAENVDYFFTEINGDPDFVDNIAVGDLLWFGDGYISPIASITIDPNDRENSYVTISQPVTSLIGPTGPQGPRGYDGVSVTNASVNASGYLIITLSNGLTVNTGYVVGPQGTTGPEGPEGPQGPTGPTGVSITNVAIDGNQHLIVTLSDGSSIDAGSVSSGGIQAVTINEALSSGSMLLEDVAKLSNDGAVIVGSSFGRVYVKFQETSTNIYFIYLSYSSNRIQVNNIAVTKSTGAWSQNTELFENNTLKSGSATNGQVLTADGNGGSSWQTPSGSGVNVVTLNALSGTLTNDEYNTLLNENSIIDYYVTNHKLYVKKQETSTEMRFDYLDQYDYISRYTINKSTKAYSHSYVKLTYTGIDSGTATNGQVLTANGNGGASWQNAGGGGVYLHTLTLTTNVGKLYFEIPKSSNTSITISNFATITSGSYFNQTRLLPCNFSYYSTTSQKWRQGIGVYNNNGNLYFVYYNADDTAKTINEANLGSISGMSILDIVKDW